MLEVELGEGERDRAAVGVADDPLAVFHVVVVPCANRTLRHGRALHKQMRVGSRLGRHARHWRYLTSTQDAVYRAHRRWVG